jgi:hypothetical protein
VAEVNDRADLYAEFITSPMLGQVITIGPIGADLTDIALAPSGQLYGINRSSDLYTVNQGTGAATLVGPVGHGLVGLVVPATARSMARAQAARGHKSCDRIGHASWVGYWIQFFGRPRV